MLELMVMPPSPDDGTDATTLVAFIEWLSGHYCAFSEDLGQPSPGSSSHRDTEVVADGRMAAWHHPPVGRVCGLTWRR